jgi:plasmid stabilization system protein ParE
MSRTLRIRVRAEFDLDELVEYIARRDRHAALRFRDRVQETVSRIVRWPHLGTQRVTETGRHVRLRQVLRYPKYVVIYAVTDQLIDILRVVRGTRNLDVFLPD